MSRIVMKFGGTSVGTADCMRRAAALVQRSAREHEVVVVVSALSKVTDTIVAALQAAKSGREDEVVSLCEKLRQRHAEVTGELFPFRVPAKLQTDIEDSLRRLAEICAGMAQLRTSSPQIGDMALALGEEIAARILTEVLSQLGVSAGYVDSARVLQTDAKFGEANPDLEATSRRARAEVLPLLAQCTVPVVTGYRGATASGQLTTLGRGGSDYSATVLGAALAADEVWIWTDVDGVLTADPRVCPNASTLSEISFAEAVELSHYGAKVIHERAVRPAREAGIPVWIKNSFRPELPGTRIDGLAPPDMRTVKAVSAVPRASLITVSTRQDGHFAETLGRLLMRLAAEHVELLLLTQSSQSALGLVVRENDEPRVVELIERLFRTELRHGVLDPISVQREIAVIAVLGEAMKGKPGILARLFGAVAARQVSVIAVAQGASELNICFAVPSTAANTVVQAVHDEFCVLGAPEAIAPVLQTEAPVQALHT
jgi:aspartate kinase